MVLKHRRGSGFTLIELVVAAAILSVISISIFSYSMMSNRIFKSGAADNTLKQQGMNIGEQLRNDLNRMTNTVAGGWTYTLNTSISGNLIIGYDHVTKSNTYGNTVTWRVEYSALDPDNGLDDDGDGSIDEMDLVRVENGFSVVKSSNIPEGTFRISETGKVITFQIFFSKFVGEASKTVTHNTNPISITLQ